ncbi:hypothetical protein [Mangrovibacterium diazotrophicum]|uniref:Outer membrane protein with beta-barrel domain n=1 Tax=Mangrovibacterium diazotrophicum TaxID=1261403 RepID=A0A419WBH9_9BACT|nr:hypothetical protein [Mangrovibacterium diazotrophicum]RKD92817.1 hypothetical protein BC643_3194 [Mangrovibacterium diazotrophicum]
MIRPGVLLIFMFVCIRLSAQEITPHSYYISIDGMLGNFIGHEFQFNYVLSEKYTFRFGHAFQDRKAASIPADFSGGLAGGLTFGLTNPRDEIQSYQLLVGRIFMIEDQHKARLNLSAGIARSHLKEYTNWKGENNGILSLGWNYSADLVSSEKWSFVFNPRLEIVATRYLGVSLSTFLQYNSSGTTWGFGAGLLLGKLRNKQK